MEEILRILLAAALEAGLGVLAEAGFGDKARELRDHLIHTGEKKLRQAFAQAYKKAASASGEEALQPLLKHRPFQEEVVAALLDPLTSFDIQAAAEVWGEKLPQQARSLRLFFNSLQNALLADATWGPILERYQSLRSQKEIQQVLRQKGLPVTEREVVHEAGVVVYGSVTVMKGDVVLGEKTDVKVGNVQAEDSVVAVAGRDVIINQGPGGPDQAALRRAYLNHVLERAGQLALSGIDPKAASQAETRLSLGAVYIALLTQTTEAQAEKKQAKPEAEMAVERERRRLSAVEQLNRQSRLVLLGEPGSGKTTFVNFVAVCLAGEALGEPEMNLKLLIAPLLADDKGGEKKKPRRQPWEHGVLLPVRVILRDFAARGLPPVGVEATAKHIWDFIASELEAASLGGYGPYLQDELRKQGGLVMLDGLDEVPEADQRRTQIKQAVEDFAAAFPRCRLLITSRTYAYQNQDWRLQGFADTALAPFSRGQIRRFVERWYAHIAGLRGLNLSDAQGRAEMLKKAIFTSDRLMGLAERPLLLTLMASLHAWRGGSLPEQREELYSDTVDLLLDWWESPKLMRDAQGKVVVSQPSLAEWLKVDRQKVRSLLNELTGTADVPEAELVSGLLRLSSDPDLKPARLVEFLSQRAGLLIPRGVGVYTFPHRTFQEYLAACYLTDHDYPEQVAELACEDFNRWREVALLAGAKAARGTASAIWSLVDALCYEEKARPECPGEFLWGAHLAGQALVETADLRHVSERNQGKVTRVSNWLVQVIGTERLPAIERAQAGDSLARLGDPRFDPRHWFLPAEERLGFILIPGGKFWMGSADADADAYDNEKPLHEVYLPDFYIARYPVTVAQFRSFVTESRFHPRYPDCLSDLANRPVRWVSWHEAMAFCDWLGEKLKEISGQRLTASEQKEKGIFLDEIDECFWGGLAQSRLRVSLPSEAEWEKVARGPDPSLPFPGSEGEVRVASRIYPWGDEFDPQKLNMAGTGIGDTSAVGCFAAGASPYGVLDLSGNVWEWTRSLFKGYPYVPEDGRENPNDPGVRVLRGGSFSNIAKAIRCASRRGYNPVYGYSLHGFRVVVSPFAAGL